ncbi:hypothetical protein B0H14DRAFT_2597145 [Mycena olivaceomarginata]|nr:hypothetical protein B0H14DRAFT_2597145 [Mycena olivaceomarginata]
MGTAEQQRTQKAIQRFKFLPFAPFLLERRHRAFPSMLISKKACDWPRSISGHSARTDRELDQGLVSSVISKREISDCLWKAGIRMDDAYSLEKRSEVKGHSVLKQYTSRMRMYLQFWMILMMHQEDGWDPHRFRLGVDLYIWAFLKWEYCQNRRESMGTQQEHGIQVLASVLELNIRFQRHFQPVLVGSLRTQVTQSYSKSHDE